MKITFDPYDPSDVEKILLIVGSSETAPAANISTGGERVDPNDVDDDAVDSNGMKHDPEIHADTKTQNADGSWKAARGKADLAKKALADFKAANPDVNAETSKAGLPGMTAKKTLPGMTSGTVAIETPPEPISFEQIVDRFATMMEDGIITDHAAVYHDAGVTDPALVETNETERAKLNAELDKIAAANAA